MAKIPRTYKSLKFSEQEKKNGTWKGYLGGGADQWDQRGSYQFELFKHLGLKPCHTLCDFGCGPLRAGRYLIKYLETGNYAGFDINSDFIDIARSIVAEDPRLAPKHPALHSVDQADFLDTEYDIIILFSVMNHIKGGPERRALLQRLQTVPQHTTSYITHAKWFARNPDRFDLQIPHRLITEADVPAHFGPLENGWTQASSVFPILEMSHNLNA